MKSISVVHALSSLEYSGAEIMLYQAYDIFEENNFEVTLLAQEEKIGLFEEKMRAKGYKIDHINSLKRLQVLVQFYKYFKKNKFNVVHLHIDDLYIWRVILLRLTGHHNIVRTYHSSWVFTGWLRFKRTLHRRWATMLGVKNHSIGTAVYENEKKTFRNNSIIINNWIKLNPALFEKREKVRAEKRKELGINEKSFVIISVGGCVGLKNHPFIINLVKALNNEGLQTTYLHAGKGMDEPAEQALAENIGVKSQVVFTGNRTDIPELLICADVYLMPSSYEGLSIALIEAMYYNGLVVVNDAPGLSNMIVHGETGFVINIKDQRGYINLIKSLNYGYVDVTTIKETARKFATENFSMEKNALELMDLYKLNTQFE